jgi:hypothetical protein
MEDKTEILKQDRLQGDEIDRKLLIGKNVIVQDFRSLKSKYTGMYGIVQAEVEENKKHVIFIINSFMLKQLKGVKPENFPVIVKIAQHENYTRFERVL